MKWTVFRLKGMCSLVKRSSVEGMIAVAGKVVVTWRKSKEKFNAEVTNVM